MIHRETFFHFRRRPAAGVRIGAIVFLISIAAAGGFALGKRESSEPDPATAMAGAMESTESGTGTAVLAGGCFWGVEAVFERLDGVLDVVSGYAGGDADTASYRLVGSGSRWGFSSRYISST